MVDFKKHLTNFVREDDGAETIEYISIIAVVAVLISVVLGIVVILQSKLDQAADTIDGITVPGAGTTPSTSSTPSTP